MTYYILTVSGMSGNEEHVLTANHDGSTTSFPNVDTNDGPERAAYLEWLAEGNTPEPWPPAE